MTADVVYTTMCKKLGRVPLSVATLRRLLKYDVESNTLVWVRRKEPVVIDKTGNVLVRGQFIPAIFLNDTLRDGEFPDWGVPVSSGITKQRGQYMVIAHYGDKAIFGGIYASEDEARRAYGVLVKYINDSIASSKQTAGAIAALTGARKDNKTGYRGVSYLAARKKFIGRVTVDLKTYSVGSFDTPQAAYAAVLAEEARIR